MKLYYNGVALHELGEVHHAGQRYAPDPAAAPQRLRSVWRVTLQFWEHSLVENLTLRERAQAALKTATGTLLWLDDNDQPLLNREVHVADHEWPEGGGGEVRHQVLNLEFWWWDNGVTCPAGTAQYTATGSMTVIELGPVQSFTESLSVSRADALRSNRTLAQGKVALSGQYQPDQSLSIADRRAAALAWIESATAALASKDGRLQHGTGFDKTVRVESFKPDVNATADAVTWSLDATFTRWPDETGYLLVDYNIREKESQSAGQRVVTLAGRIRSQSAAAARSKLSALRSALSSRYVGYSLLTEGDPETDERWIDGDDGASFLELSFSESFRVSTDTAVQEWTLRLRDAEDPATGLVQRSYSGTVTASASSFDAAYNAATTKARALGANKHSVLLAGEISAGDSQQSSGNAGTGSTRFCRVEFAFTYRLIAGVRLHLEVHSELVADTFGPSRESVSGYAAAANLATCRQAYVDLKAAFAGLIVEQERISERRVIATQQGSAGALYSPPSAGTWGATINSPEQTDGTPESSDGIAMPKPTTPGALTTGTNERQIERLEFSFTAVRPRLADTVAVKYSWVTEVDYITLETSTTIAGLVQAATETEANSAITALIPVGARVLKRRLGAERLKVYGDMGSPTPLPATDPDTGKPGLPLGYEFSVTWCTALTGDAALLEVSVTEEIEAGGPRLVEQPTAFGVPVIQECGYTSARRVIRVSAKSSSESAAMNFCKAQWRLAWGSTLDGGSALDASGGVDSTTGFHRVRTSDGVILGWFQPPRFTKQPTFTRLPGSPVVRGGGANVQVWQVSAEFAEIIPNGLVATPNAW